MGLLALITAKFGTVTDGKYKGCKFAVGIDNNKLTKDFNQFLFIKGFNEIARIYVWKVVKHEELSEDSSGVVFKFTWEDGTSSIILMSHEQGQSRIDKIKMIRDCLKRVDENKI